MPLFGVDISSNNSQLHLASLKPQGYSFVTARCVAAGNRRDASYPTFYAQAKAAGLQFAAYVFPWTGISVANTAQVAADYIGDKSIPVMIDWENDGKGPGASVPSYAFAKSLFDALKAKGLNVRSIYTYRPYWQSQGSHLFTDRPWKLINANYGGNPYTTAADAYPGDTSIGWAPYGGLTPTILQFGSEIKITGYNDTVITHRDRGGIDGNAFKGTLDQLRKTGLFKDFAPKPVPLPIIKESNTMIRVAPLLSEVPAGTPWPGVFIWDGLNLTHITSHADHVEIAKSLPEIVQISWAQWEEIVNGQHRYML